MISNFSISFLTSVICFFGWLVVWLVGFKNYNGQNGYDVIYYFGFDLHYLRADDSSVFSCLCWLFMFFGKYLFRFFVHFELFIFYYWVVIVLYTLVRYMFCKYFLSFCMLLFHFLKLLLLNRNLHVHIWYRAQTALKRMRSKNQQRVTLRYTTFLYYCPLKLNSKQINLLLCARLCRE